jgi:UDP-GlcNAc:undecaprenyl-phosphate/decaprenyl-phosphate GlcNAc-1-phosphate transferase
VTAGWQIACAGVLTFLVVLALVPVMKRYALVRGITDHPATGKAHRSPTPYLGGVAIACGALGASFLLPDWQGDAALIFGAAALVAVVGLWDDLKKVGPGVRILVECAAAGIAVAAGARVQIFDDPIDIGITVVFIIVITNSFNLLDNMDAAAGTIAATVATALAVCALLQGQVLVGGLAVVVAAACMAFLVYNWHPARIFMGDAGSLFLGFMLAVIALKVRTDVPRFESALAVVLILGAAVFDTTLVVISRTLRGRSIMVGGTDHTAHRLTLLGLRPQVVTAVMVASTAYLGVIGVLVARGVIDGLVALPLAIVPGLIALASLLRVGVYVEDANAERSELILPSTALRATPRPRALRRRRATPGEG